MTGCLRSGNTFENTPLDKLAEWDDVHAFGLKRLLELPRHFHRAGRIAVEAEAVSLQLDQVSCESPWPCPL